MLDIGFQELLLVGVIALLVVGPQRLPGLARTAGLYLHKLRRCVGDVRADVERELHADGLRRSLRETTQVDDLYDVVKDARSSLDEVRGTLNEARDVLRQDPSAGSAVRRDAPAAPAVAAVETSPPAISTEAGRMSDGQGTERAGGSSGP